MTNVAVSGWSGAGSTSVTLILALMLQRKYVYIGSVFRYIGEYLGYGDEGMSRIEADLLLERQIGKLMDRYVDWVLMNDENVILESDLSCFRIGKNKEVFSVFLEASLEDRSNRVMSDLRGDDAVSVLEARDIVHKELYDELWNVDFFDRDLIRQKYWYVVDNGKISLKQTVNRVLELMAGFEGLKDEYKWEELKLEIDGWVDIFEQEGKKGLRDRLEKMGLLWGQGLILKHLNELFEGEVEKLPLFVVELIRREKFRL